MASQDAGGLRAASRGHCRPGGHSLSDRLSRAATAGCAAWAGPSSGPRAEDVTSGRAPGDLHFSLPREEGRSSPSPSRTSQNPRALGGAGITPVCQVRSSVSGQLAGPVSGRLFLLLGLWPLGSQPSR